MTTMRRCLTTAGHPEDGREALVDRLAMAWHHHLGDVGVLVVGDRRVGRRGLVELGWDPGCRCWGSGTASKARLRRGVEPEWDSEPHVKDAISRYLT